MKKTLTALLLGIGLPILAGSCIPDSKPETQLERTVTEETPGFSKQELAVIIEAKNKVNKKYQEQKIVFYEDNSIIAAGRSPGLCKDNRECLPQDFDYERLGDYFVILLHDYKSHEEDFEKERGMPLDRRWHVPYKQPMIGSVIHEIAHTYWFMLTQEEKEILAKIFSDVDKNIPEDLKGKPIQGHASFYSYFYWISPEADKEMVRDFSDEQFAETFTYHVLGCSHMNKDKGFVKKLNAVKKAMKRFEK